MMTANSIMWIGFHICGAVDSRLSFSALEHWSKDEVMLVLCDQCVSWGECNTCHLRFFLKFDPYLEPEKGSKFSIDFTPYVRAVTTFHSSPLIHSLVMFAMQHTKCSTWNIYDHFYDGGLWLQNKTCCPGSRLLFMLFPSYCQLPEPSSVLGSMHYGIWPSKSILSVASIHLLLYMAFVHSSQPSSLSSESNLL